ncbi:MAG: hypothetical protein EXS10_03160 [Phycisphaerales bacterium]|nr:hypothetical protein [Phycisphaerales bacterium]
MSRPALLARAVAPFALSSITTLAGVMCMPTTSALAAPQAAPVVGLRAADPSRHAIVGATVTTKPGTTIEHATILIRDGVIEAVGADLAIPAGYRVWDAKDRVILPAFIESALCVDSAELAKSYARLPGAHWSEHVTPQLEGEQLTLPDATAEELRKLGFAIARVLPKDGIFRGTSDTRLLVGAASTTTTASTRALELAADEVLFVGAKPRRSFDPGSMMPGVGTPGIATPARPTGAEEEWTNYPSSLMGSIAVLRQGFLDGQWRDATLDAFANADGTGSLPPLEADALDALVDCVRGKQRVMFDASDELDVLRFASLARELQLNATMLTSGLEFRSEVDVLATKLPLIVALDFPTAPDLTSPTASEGVSLAELLTWRYAPTNPKRMLNGGATIAITTNRLTDRAVFRKRLAEALRHGLTKDEALAALTTTPSAMLGISARAGTLEPGKIANFIVSKGDPFVADSEFESLWIAGAPTRLPEPQPSLKPGLYRAVNGTQQFEMDLAKSRISAVLAEGKTLKAKKVKVDRERFSFTCDATFFGDATATGTLRVSGAGSGEGCDLTIETSTGQRAVVALLREGDLPPSDPSKTRDVANVQADAAPPVDAPQENSTTEVAAATDATAPKTPPKEDLSRLAKEVLPSPLGAFGRTRAPLQGTIFLNDATVWTLASNGTLAQGDVLIVDGKIAAVGAELTPPEGAVVLEAKGKHLTPGLIDCHSHTGISGGVNEGGQACTAEVWIGDVIDPNDINWYRQLSGGLVAVNQLHGSANPMGGRNSVVKIRWGTNAEHFRMQGAPLGIKFALGENVVRSKRRYPSSRMGVVTFMEDQFLAAQEYRAAHVRFAALDPETQARTMPPRPDLELQTLAEVLDGTRLVHCHSYRQDEILQMLRTADRFGFKIGTLQHILEGYKVADEIAKHGAGASSFSDWWAYKEEVMDAIPWNGAMLQNAGVLVSFNSDSDELARHMNTEAAKAVRYGQLSPEDALKLVTLNPAKQLHIDARTGSIEVGKDADLALWNGDPLSAFTRCEMTFVDGVRRFDIREDQALWAEATARRGELLSAAVAASEDAPSASGGREGGGGEGRMGRGRGRPTSLLERLLDEREDLLWARVARGLDAFPRNAGDCGCEENDTSMNNAQSETEVGAAR